MNKKELDIFFDNVFYRLLLERDQKARMDPKNQKDYELKYELLAELAAMGYSMKYGFEIEYYPFTKEDGAVVPLIASYFGKFDNQGTEAALCDALGRKGLFAATEPLIKRYYELRPPNYNSLVAISALQSLLKIKNPNYVSEYIQMISDEDYRPEHLEWTIELLGQLKAREAIPQMLKLLDIEPFGTFMPEEKQYKISIECIRTFSKFNDRTLIPHIEKFLEPEKLPQFSRDRKWPDPEYPHADLIKNVKKITEKSIARILKYSK